MLSMLIASEVRTNTTVYMYSLRSNTYAEGGSVAVGLIVQKFVAMNTSTRRYSFAAGVRSAAWQRNPP